MTEHEMVRWQHRLKGGEFQKLLELGVMQSKRSQRVGHS